MDCPMHVAQNMQKKLVHAAWMREGLVHLFLTFGKKFPIITMRSVHYYVVLHFLKQCILFQLLISFPSPLRPANGRTYQALDVLPRKLTNKHSALFPTHACKVCFLLQITD